MGGAAAHFSRSYAEARDRLLALATRRRCTIRSRRHPSSRGADGEVLAMDAVAHGDVAARAVLVVSSATHGVEGLAGSGIQSALLDDERVLRELDATGVRLVLLHAINPWGFAHDARGDDGNVDVNRNFRDFAAVLPRNAAYARLHATLVPPLWPPSIGNEIHLLLAVMRAGGREAFKDAISRGQCEFADGLFYGGREPCWSNRMLREAIAEAGRHASAVGWIDLHTGLGRRGHGEMIFNGHHRAQDLARARQWWGAGVTSMYDMSSVSSEVAGANFAALDALASEGKTCAAITIEFGTRSQRVVLGALRARQWLTNHPDAPASRRRTILRASRDAFYVDEDGWKDALYTTTRDAVLRGAAALRRATGATS